MCHRARRRAVPAGDARQPHYAASTHIHPDAARTSCCYAQEEINKLIGKVEQRGYASAAAELHYKNGRIKLDFALGRGKKLYDKRDTSREKDWAAREELDEETTRAAGTASNVP